MTILSCPWKEKEKETACGQHWKSIYESFNTIQPGAKELEMEQFQGAA